ncbi:hypothetical protein DFJ68_3236 [Terracoccus luteus]|uniref:Uncharacterized protein n=1 Tax=Terracoccus luteus TaxID=53356 RepID=A0A495Y4R4_9MICO|nr:hypothetical protein [Terracoccus luteus]RKT79758.1 hypothetical protein DFJ68_3236 [Terracoccus luteus]
MSDPSDQKTPAAVTDEQGRRAWLDADVRAERWMPVKGLAVAALVVAVGWARARWWL